MERQEQCDQYLEDTEKLCTYPQRLKQNTWVLQIQKQEFENE